MLSEDDSFYDKEIKSDISYYGRLAFSSGLPVKRSLYNYLPCHTDSIATPMASLCFITRSTQRKVWHQGLPTEQLLKVPHTPRLVCGQIPTD